MKRYYWEIALDWVVAKIRLEIYHYQERRNTEKTFRGPPFNLDSQEAVDERRRRERVAWYYG